MKFTNRGHRIQADREECEKVKKELIELYKERDLVRSEIADQRRGQSEVATTKKKNEEELGNIIPILVELQKQIKDNSKDFYNLTDKQKQKIKKLNKEIYKKVTELGEYEKKELIDIDGLNLKYKNELQAVKNEVKEAELRLVQLIKSMNEFEIFRTDTSQKLEKERQYIEKTKSNLVKRESECKRQEKRLKKLHLEIKNKKNVKS